MSIESKVELLPPVYIKEDGTILQAKDVVFLPIPEEIKLAEPIQTDVRNFLEKKYIISGFVKKTGIIYAAVKNYDNPNEVNFFPPEVLMLDEKLN